MTTGNDFDLARSTYQNYRYCYENGHQQWLVKAFRCMEFWKGNQWDLADVRKLAAAGRPALTFNTIESLTRALLGMQRSLRNDVRFAPTAPTDENGAQVRDSLWLYTQNRNKLDFLESDNYLRGMITGRAFYDLRVDFCENLQGEISIKAKRPQDVVLDPQFLDYDPSEWPQIFDVTWANLLDIEYLYGKDASDELMTSVDPAFFDIDDLAQMRDFGSLPYYYDGYSDSAIDRRLVRAHKVIGRQYQVLKRKDCFVDTETGDFKEIPESLPKERVQKILKTVPGLAIMKRQVKTIRWVVTSGQLVLHDEDSPYSAYTLVPYFPTMLDGITMGVVESLLDPAMLFNKVTSQELHIINTTANSGWILKKGTLKNMSTEDLENIGARTGLVLEVEQVADVEKIQPNTVPTGHDRISTKADSIMRQLSGAPNGARGYAREDVSGDAIELNQAASDVNSAGWLTNLYRSRQLLAERSQDCWTAYYTEERAIMINRGSVYRPDFQQIMLNQVTDEGTVVNDVTSGKYTTTLVPSPTRTTMTESEFSYLVKLRTEVGMQIPDDVMIELAPIANKLQLIQRLKGDSNQAQADAQAAAKQQADLEAQLTSANIEKETGAAQLNQARANKANTEANADPDKAYLQVEGARIQSNERIEQQRIGLEQQKLGLQRRTSNQGTALQLTKIESDAATAKQKNVVELAKHASKPPPIKPPVKPAASKKAKPKRRSA